jgi:hypothetical protein
MYLPQRLLPESLDWEETTITLKGIDIAVFRSLGGS